MESIFRGCSGWARHSWSSARRWTLGFSVKKSSETSPVERGWKIVDFYPSYSLKKKHLIGGWVSTHLKNMHKSNWVHLPQVSGVKIPKIFELPPPSHQASTVPKLYPWVWRFWGPQTSTQSPHAWREEQLPPHDFSRFVHFTAFVDV